MRGFRALSYSVRINSGNERKHESLQYWMLKPLINNVDHQTLKTVSLGPLGLLIAIWTLQIEPIPGPFSVWFQQRLWWTASHLLSHAWDEILEGYIYDGHASAEFNGVDPELIPRFVEGEQAALSPWERCVYEPHFHSSRLTLAALQVSLKMDLGQCCISSLKSHPRSTGHLCETRPEKLNMERQPSSIAPLYFPKTELYDRQLVVI